MPGRGGRFWVDLTGEPMLDAPVGDPAMGGHAGFGLGLALARPERKLVLFDSEGDILMSLGMLATIAEQAPANFYHFLLDNEVYATTGGQPVPNAKNVAYDKLALASGVPARPAFDEIADLSRELPASSRPGPGFVAQGLSRNRERADRPAAALADPHPRPGARDLREKLAAAG